ncbi:hypothetical protein NDU88_003919 [Pleurodeles waltl]|uniref:Uncharacterized protein n=1 Tax=Pleurodeles waltl TaxID=8319 RepID=A0AAV7W3I4_PLEWA|nr:hypothetical protein NDU88_003919 [Pleurodeles waltl]
MPEEAGSLGKRNRQEDPEAVGVLNPIQERSERSAAGEGNRRRTANEADGGIMKVGPGTGLQGIDAPTATDTTSAEDALEKGDAEGPAMFWEECGPLRKLADKEGKIKSKKGEMNYGRVKEGQKEGREIVKKEGMKGKVKMNGKEK